MKVFAFVEEPHEEETGMDPVQDGRRTLKTLRKIDVSMPVAHAPMVSPLARDLVLHGYSKTLKTLGKSNGSGHCEQIKVVAAARGWSLDSRFGLILSVRKRCSSL
jgi:hypothetical protein